MTGIGGPDRERDERPDRGAPRRAELVGVEAELLADEHVERGLGVLRRSGGRSWRPRRAAKPLARYAAASSASSSSGIASISARSSAIWRSNSSRWLCMLMYSPAAMLNAPASRPAMPARRTKLGLPRDGAGHAHDQRQVADQAVAHAEDDRAERARTGRSSGATSRAGRSRPRSGRVRATATPSRRIVATRDPGDAPPAFSRSQITRVLALVGGDRGDLGRGVLGVVRVFLVALERLDQVRDGARSRTGGR